MIENREMAAFAKALWDNYIKFRNNEADASNVSYYKAQVTAKPSNGVLTVKRPFDSTGYNVACPSYMDDISVGGQVLVLRFGNDNNLKNHFVIDNAARTMLASAIATGSSITFPISIANGGTNATTLSGAQANLGIPTASTATPSMDGTGSAGTASTYARGDHTHPADTSKADVSSTVSNVSFNTSNNKLFKTINGTTTEVVQFETVATTGDYADLDNKPTIPTASSATPIVDGAGSAGSSTDYARGDHVHPKITQALSISNNVITLTGSDGTTSSVTLPVWDGSYSAVNNS